MNKLIVVAMMVALPQMAHAIYKCKAADGRVDYSEFACPVAKQALKIDGLPARHQPPATQAAAPVDAEQVMRAEPPRSIAPSKPSIARGVEAEAEPGSRLAAVIAVLEDLDADGRDCEWALKGPGRSMDTCARFLPQTMERGAWSRAVSELQSLAKDRALAERHPGQLERAKQLSERVAGRSKLARAYLFSGR
ncbi:MAG: DUF4124 domain-containing protein [Betaproteobacteria bacterium]|nr:MAG: DUF4124 domain-containing protein [Betaproteobacteria bacterium]